MTIMSEDSIGSPCWIENIFSNGRNDNRVEIVFIELPSLMDWLAVDGVGPGGKRTALMGWFICIDGSKKLAFSESSNDISNIDALAGLQDESCSEIVGEFVVLTAKVFQSTLGMIWTKFDILYTASPFLLTRWAALRLDLWSNIYLHLSKVRKRSAKFPLEKAGLIFSAQPQTLAHADVTLQGAKSRLKTYFRDDPSLEKRPWEILKLNFALIWRSGVGNWQPVNSLWRVMKGPINDWPLAMWLPQCRREIWYHGEWHIRDAWWWFGWELIDVLWLTTRVVLPERHGSRWCYRVSTDVTSGAMPSEIWQDCLFLQPLMLT